MKEKEPEAPVVTGEAQVVTEEAPVEPVKPLYQLDPKDEGTIQISTDGGATWKAFKSYKPKSQAKASLAIWQAK